MLKVLFHPDFKEGIIKDWFSIKQQGIHKAEKSQPLVSFMVKTPKTQIFSPVYIYKPFIHHKSAKHFDVVFESLVGLWEIKR